VAVALDDLRGALGGFLCSLCKTVKSHHRGKILLYGHSGTVFRPSLEMTRCDPTICGRL
jgi:hypothetical protein